MPTDFAPGSAAAVTAPFASAARLDAEKLDCYRLAVDFQALAARLLPARGVSSLRDQLDRASVSIVLNIAEGAGRFSPADKGRFYAIATRQRDGMRRHRGRHLRPTACFA